MWVVISYDDFKFIKSTKPFKMKFGNTRIYIFKNKPVQINDSFSGHGDMWYVKRYNDHKLFKVVKEWQ